MDHLSALLHQISPHLRRLPSGRAVLAEWLAYQKSSGSGAVEWVLSSKRGVRSDHRCVSPGSISRLDILVITSPALGHFPWTLCAGSQAPVGLDVMRDLDT